jgi:Flp pilus assembly protein TadG
MRPGLGAFRDQSGAAAVEFALIAPALLMILLGIIQFGITLNNYLELTDGVRSGGRTFAVSRSSSTPYTSTIAAIEASAPNLSATQIANNTTVEVNGAQCTSDSDCSNKLTAAPGGAGYVSTSYSCDLHVMGVDFAPGCTLTSTTTDLIE